MTEAEGQLSNIDARNAIHCLMRCAVLFLCCCHVIGDMIVDDSHVHFHHQTLRFGVIRSAPSFGETVRRAHEEAKKMRKKTIASCSGPCRSFFTNEVNVARHGWGGAVHGSNNKLDRGVPILGAPRNHNPTCLNLVAQATSHCGLDPAPYVTDVLVPSLARIPQRNAPYSHTRKAHAGHQ